MTHFAFESIKWLFRLSALGLVINISNADYQDEVFLTEVVDWQIVFWPYTEPATCVARASLFSENQQHHLGVNGVEGVWTWWVYTSDPELFSMESKAPLKFEFGDGSVHSVVASSQNNLLISESLSIELLDSFSKSNQLVLSLGEKPLAHISLGSGQELLAALETCHQERALAILEITNHESRISELREKGQFQQTLDGLAVILRLTEQAYGENHMAVADVLNKISLTYSELGSHDRALEAQERRLEIAKLTWGPNAPETAQEVHALATDYVHASRFDEAEPYALAAIKFGKKSSDIDERELNAWLGTLAQIYIGQGRFGDAEQLLTSELREQESLLGPEHPALIELINGLAYIKGVLGQYADLENLEERALEILIKTYGKQSLEVSEQYERLAQTYIWRGRLGESCALTKKAFAIRKKNMGNDFPQLEANALGSILINAASCYEVSGRLSEAEATLKSAITILGEQNDSLNGTTLARALAQLATLVGSKFGYYEEAEDYMTTALELLERYGRKQSLEYITHLDLMATNYRNQRRFDEAERIYKETLTRLGTQSEDSPQIAETLANLADLYMGQLRFDEAEKMLRRALNILDKATDSAYIDAEWRIAQLFIIYANQGRKFEELDPDALQRLNKSDTDGEGDYVENLLYSYFLKNEKELGPEHPELVSWLEILSVYCIDFNCHKADPEALLMRALGIREKELGAEHPKVAQSYYYLADYYLEEDQLKDAARNYESALTLQAKTLGTLHPDVANSLNGLATVYQNLKKSDLEQDARQRVLNIVVNQSGQNESAFDFEVRDNAVAYLRLLSDKQNLDEQSQAEKIAAVQIARGQVKGEVFRQLGERLFRGGNSPLAELIRQRQDLTQQLSAVEQRLIEAYALNAGERREVTERLRGQLDAIRTQELELSERLQKDFPEYAEFEDSRLTSITALQHILRPHEAALAWILGDDASYLLIVPSKGDLKLRALNTTQQEISSSVDTLHAALDLGSPDHLGELAPFPAALAFTLFSQLFGENWKDDLRDIDKLVLVPEGPLTRLAFPALLTEQADLVELPPFSADYKKAQWLVRRFSVSIVPTLSSITVLRNASIKGQAEKPFLGIGDPLLNDHPSKNRGVLDDHEPVEHSIVRNIRNVSDIQPQPANSVEMRRTRLKRIRQQPSLPDTAVEIKRIAGLLHASNDDLFLREKATEHNLKAQALDQYRLVSFATHGVLAGELGFGIEPGLILTPPEEPTDLDDGFLSLSEVAQLHLNAEWVMLSACNTAGAAANSNRWFGNSGTDSVTEGLTGMAKAFTYAGTRAMLVSHWSVSSATTVELIENIIRNYSKGNLSRSAAHREAMITLIESSDRVKSHPSIWAPFIIFGDG